MGLYQYQFRFPDGPPDLDGVLADVRARLGNTRGVDSLYIEADGLVVATTMMDPFTHHVLAAALLDRGGQAMNFSGEPVELAVPQWAHEPVHQMSWRERMSIRLGWWGWLFGTIRA